MPSTRLSSTRFTSRSTGSRPTARRMRSKSCSTGKNEPVDDSLEYVEVAEDIGLPVDEYRELAEELRALGVSVGHDVIPSIRSIEEIEQPSQDR